jgi:catechol 2,3-dioxygenase-like lactoylglutathione lyase family enzyme
MKLNHLNLAVPNVAETAAFFEKYFQMRRLETKGDNVLTVLSDEAGFVLILNNFDASTVPTYPRDFHVGFIRETQAQVTEVYEQMTADGVDVKPPRSAHGGWGFYVHSPGGIQVEVTAYSN